jgi:hypothetical protein
MSVVVGLSVIKQQRWSASSIKRVGAELVRPQRMTGTTDLLSQIGGLMGKVFHFGF